MSAKLDDLIEFMKFTHEIRNVRRALLLETDKRYENDAEHQYQLALVAWFLIDQDDLPLDRYRCIGMAMVHDIAEAYTGDIIVFATPEERAEQTKREKEAIKKLRKVWPNFSSMHELIDEYEARETEEGKFIYALDKLVPIINNYLYDGKAWKRHGISFDRLKEVKKGKVDANPHVEKYYKQALKLLEKNPQLFSA